jgi:hypothetical protein
MVVTDTKIHLSLLTTIGVTVLEVVKKLSKKLSWDVSSVSFWKIMDQVWVNYHVDPHSILFSRWL